MRGELFSTQTWIVPGVTKVQEKWAADSRESLDQKTWFQPQFHHLLCDLQHRTCASLSFYFFFYTKQVISPTPEEWRRLTRQPDRTWWGLLPSPAPTLPVASSQASSVGQHGSLNTRGTPYGSRLSDKLPQAHWHHPEMNTRGEQGRDGEDKLAHPCPIASHRHTLNPLNNLRFMLLCPLYREEMQAQQV